MIENYAVINGKRVELTDEQVKALGVESVETKTNPFNRMGLGSYCYSLNFDGTAWTFTEDNSMKVNHMYRNCNYFNDKDFAQQVALHQLLYRKLLKFSYDNGFEDDQEWDCENRHYHVYYSHAYKIFTTELNYEGKHPGVYFPSQEAANRAIEEVIKPFVKEHPDFVW